MVEILHEGPIGKYRELTAEERKLVLSKQAKLKQIEEAIADLKKQKSEIIAGCDHRFFHDTAGHPYDVRHCAICKHTQLI